MNLSARLSKHMVAAAAVAAGVAAAADAAVIIQNVNIVVPNNIDGVYLNVVTLAQGTSGSAVAGWDINPYSASSGTGSFNLWGPTTQTWFSASGSSAGPFFLSEGTVVGGAASNFFRPGPTNIGGQATLNSDNNFLGFRFVHEGNGNQIHFGWIRVAFGANAGERTITQIAYESVAGVGILVPGPAGLAVLAGGAAFGSRRRRK